MSLFLFERLFSLFDPLVFLETGLTGSSEIVQWFVIHGVSIISRLMLVIKNSLIEHVLHIVLRTTSSCKMAVFLVYSVNGCNSDLLSHVTHRSSYMTNFSAQIPCMYDRLQLMP